MLKCAHIICKVNNLSQAVKDFKRLGFSVEWGSVPTKSNNALIWFGKGPFIELFEESKGYYIFSKLISLFCGKAAGDKLHKWYQLQEGWCDIAGEDENNDEKYNECASINRKKLVEIQKKIQKLGISTSKVIDGSRKKECGNVVKYSLFYLRPTDFPFIVSKYNSNQRPEKIVHDNGAKEIIKIVVRVVPDLEKTYKKLFENDSRIEIVQGNSTEIADVAISGISKKLDPKLLHGAKISYSPKKMNDLRRKM